MELVLEGITAGFDSAQALTLLQATLGISEDEANEAITSLTRGQVQRFWTNRCLPDIVEQDFRACGVLVSLI